MPTMRQEIAAAKLMENGGNLSKAMRESGYKKGYAHNPHKLKASKGWQKLMDKYLPERKVAQAHKELLVAAEIMRTRFERNESEEDIKETIAKIPGAVFIRIANIGIYKFAYYTVPVHEHRKAGVEMAYRLRGKFAPDKLAVGGLAEFEELSDDELEEAAGITQNDDRQEEST